MSLKRMGRNTSQYAEQGIEHQSSVVILCKTEITTEYSMDGTKRVSTLCVGWSYYGRVWYMFVVYNTMSMEILLKLRGILIHFQVHTGRESNQKSCATSPVRTFSFLLLFSWSWRTWKQRQTQTAKCTQWEIAFVALILCTDSHCRWWC